MIEKDEMKSFVSDIDQIISGKMVISPDSGHQDESYKELLLLAQLLAKADFTADPPERLKKLWADCIKEAELEDDELDMVAGGVNPDALPDNKGEKIL